EGTGKMDNGMFDSFTYKQSRCAYTVQCAFEYLVSLLLTDAYLAKLLRNLDFSAPLTGLVTSFINLAFVFQLFSLFVAKRKTNPKRLILTVDTISQLFFCFIYFVPFLPMSSGVRRFAVVGSILVAYFLKYLVSSLLFHWSNTFVNPDKRASFGAVKEIISLASGILFQFLVSAVVDKYEGLGNVRGAFLFIGISMLALNAGNFISILLIGRKSGPADGNDMPKKEKQPEKTWKEIFRYTFGNADFRRVLLVLVLMSGRFFVAGFMGTFKTEDLGFSMVTITVISMVGNLSRIAVSVPFGKYSDKKGYCNGFSLGLILLAVGCFANAFTAPSTRLLVIVYVLMENIALAGINQNTFNMVYSYVPSAYIAEAMAISSCVRGVMGFLFAALGSGLLSAIQGAENTFFGIPVYGQQVLSLIAGLCVLIGSIYIQTVLSKRHAMKQ
ncbi:MAG: MFS transporter, partial [Clostridia bacterium]|nr:MFS transporter [Clostridia bacterium]